MRKTRSVILEATHGGRRFTIEEDSTVGYYLYIFDEQRCSHDYLQDTLEVAKKFALEEFGVPEDAWGDATPTI
jgi:hypothetical protein